MRTSSVGDQPGLVERLVVLEAGDQITRHNTVAPDARTGIQLFAVNPAYSSIWAGRATVTPATANNGQLHL